MATARVEGESDEAGRGGDRHSVHRHAAMLQAGAVLAAGAFGALSLGQFVVFGTIIANAWLDEPVVLFGEGLLLAFGTAVTAGLILGLGLLSWRPIDKESAGAARRSRRVLRWSLAALAACTLVMLPFRLIGLNSVVMAAMMTTGSLRNWPWAVLELARVAAWLSVYFAGLAYVRGLGVWASAPRAEAGAARLKRWTLLGLAHFAVQCVLLEAATLLSSALLRGIGPEGNAFFMPSVYYPPRVLWAGLVLLGLLVFGLLAGAYAMVLNRLRVELGRWVW